MKQTNIVENLNPSYFFLISQTKTLYVGFHEGQHELHCQRFFKRFNLELINTLKLSTQNGWQPPHQQDFHTQRSETLQLLSLKQISPAFIKYDKL